VRRRRFRVGDRAAGIPGHRTAKGTLNYRLKGLPASDAEHPGKASHRANHELTRPAEPVLHNPSQAAISTANRGIT
jgi:hypothetical protein